MRQKNDWQRRSRLVPNAVIVAGFDSNPVTTGADVVVNRFPAVAGIDPIVVQTFEHVFEVILFRRSQAQRSIVNLQFTPSWRDSQGFSQISSAKFPIDLPPGL